MPEIDAPARSTAPVELFANIELPQDIGEVQESGAQGVGLFRTEFLFMNRKVLF